MGCGSSKAAQVDEPGSLEFVAKDTIDSRPEDLRKDITRMYGFFCQRRDALRPLFAEKLGIEALTDEERTTLMTILCKKDELLAQRKPLLDQTWISDVEDINRSFQRGSVNRQMLASIICARTYWQLTEISRVYEQRYGCTLLEKITREFSSVFGNVFSGANNTSVGLNKLLTYRLQPQPERDALLLFDATNGMGFDVPLLLELFCTRSNLEMRKAIDAFNVIYKRDFIELVRQKGGYKNFREFLLRMCECQRDESGRRYAPNVASKFAQELYEAGAGRTIGSNPEPFIRILCNVNRPQFESVNDAYQKNALLADITSKLGGDFQLAILTRCADKYELLAHKLDAALRGFSTDKDAISRILGCMSRPDCLKVRLAFNRLFPKRSLEDWIRTSLRSNGPFCHACMMLISDEQTMNPLGSDKEDYEIADEVEREAERFISAEVNAYNKEKVIEKGIVLLDKMIKNLRKKKFKDDGSNTKDDDDSPQMLDPTEAEEERIWVFSWDGKGKYLDGPKLSAIHKELQFLNNHTSLLLERMADENAALAGVYRSILKHRVGTEAEIRVYNAHIRSLQAYTATRMSHTSTSDMMTASMDNGSTNMGSNMGVVSGLSASSHGGHGGQGGYNAGGHGGYNAGSQGGYNAGSQGGYNAGSQGGYNAGSQGGYNAGSQGGYNAGGYNAGGYNAGGYNAGGNPPAPPDLSAYGSSSHGGGYNSTYGNQASYPSPPPSGYGQGASDFSGYGNYGSNASVVSNGSKGHAGGASSHGGAAYGNYGGYDQY